MGAESKQWVDVPRWPRAHIYSGHKKRVLVLTDDLDVQLAGKSVGPIWLIVCPHCEINPVALSAWDFMVKIRKGKLPSCGCNKGFGRNPGSISSHRKKSLQS